uniref:Uncharacterized protein n=1 Tax=viral metagenome TaxID=1070528 RepID=A0A6C0D5K2_9ZZZZ
MSKPIELGSGVVFGETNEEFNIGDMLYSAATQFDENPENSKDFINFITKKLELFFAPDNIFTFRNFGDNKNAIQKETYKINGANINYLSVTSSRNKSVVIKLSVKDKFYKNTDILLTDDTYVMYDPKHKGLLGIEGTLGGRRRKTRNMRKKSKRTFRRRRASRKM